LAFKPLLWRILQEMFVRLGKKQNPGAKALIALAFTARLKCPDTKHGFSATCKALIALAFAARLNVVP
jgi:hypothetical protein